MKVFKSGKDFAFERYGAAKENNLIEFEKFLQIVLEKRSRISWRDG